MASETGDHLDERLAAAAAVGIELGSVETGAGSGCARPGSRIPTAARRRELIN